MDVGTLASCRTAFFLVGLVYTVTHALAPFLCEIHQVHLLCLAPSQDKLPVMSD